MAPAPRTAPAVGTTARRGPDVTLNQLRYFVETANQLSMTNAARELCIAQSAISAAISQLEHQLGAQLFIRKHARGLLLTTAGADLLRGAREVLDHLDEVLDVVGDEAGQVRGRVRMACFVTLGPFVVPQLISELNAKHPQLEVDVVEVEANAVRSALRDGSVEVALTYNLGLESDLATEVVGYAEPYVALARDHRLAMAASVNLADLRHEPMVMLDLPESRQYFQSMHQAAGVAPWVRYRSTSYETVRSLVAGGHGYSILNQRPAIESTHDGGMVSAVPIEGHAPALPIVLAHNKTSRATARARTVAAAARAIFRSRDAPSRRCGPAGHAAWAAQAPSLVW